MRAVPWREMAGRVAEWDALAAGASEPNPFYESWYLLPSQRALDPEGDVILLAFESAAGLVGLMPLHRDARYSRWPVPHLRNWAHANCFVGMPLVARGQEMPFWRALLGWADGHAETALFLHLAGLPLDGPLHAALLDVLAEDDRASALVHRDERALLQAGTPRDAYFQRSVSGKKRKELRRQLTRLGELGEVRFNTLHDNQDLESWRERFLDLEAAGWKGKAGSALACSSANAKLFRDSLVGAAARNRLQRVSLELDGAPIAMLVNFIAPPGAFSFKTAFDERYARFSPGVLLQCENLQMLERSDIAWTDSCASADHPMIDHLWRERRPVGRISIGLGSNLRRTAFKLLLKAELSRNPTGVVP